MDQEKPDPIPTSDLGAASGAHSSAKSAEPLFAENRGLDACTQDQFQTEDIDYPLRSGRTLRVSAGAGHQTDQMEILSPDGRVEVEILLTASGPMVRVHGGSLKMSSTQSIQLESAGPVEINADELRVRTTRSVHLDGETIRLNCKDQPITPRRVTQTPRLCDQGNGTGHHPLPE
jgi:hypothetical protein